MDDKQTGKQNPPNVLKKRRFTRVLFFVVLTAICTVSVAAFARDRDGTKIQARSISRSSRHSDTLKAPEDVADWYYIKVDLRGKVRVTLETRQPLEITIYNSSNETQWSHSRSVGVTDVALDVEPGIYFIKIELPEGSKPSEVAYVLRVE